jgi:hypothetical protein
MKSPVTFQMGSAIDAQMFYAACSMDTIGDSDFEAYSRMSFYQGQTKEKWFYHDLPGWRIVATCLIPETANEPRTVVALSEEGDLEFYNRKGARVEKIEDAGVGDSSKGYGYVSRIRLIRGELYVCGLSGQVYQRSAANWIHCDDGLLQQAPLGIEGVDSSIAENIALTDICGYGAGGLMTIGSSGYVATYDGKQWVQQPCPVDEHLNCIFKKSESEFWICGFNGALLTGNPTAGFRDVSGIQDNAYFQSVCSFKNQIFMGASDGVYQYSNDQLKKLTVSMELGEVSHVESVNDVLWVVGEKRLATFDGYDWKGYEHPDNK